MQIGNLIQGSEEWHAHRAKHFNASDAPAMAGCSPYMTRNELLTRLHTGISPEVDPATQRRFDDGHRFEALARPLAEEIIGEEIYPITGFSGELSASFDGLTIDRAVAWEHKTLNDDLRAAFDDIESVAPEHRDATAGSLLPLHYQVQMEHQAAVSGCKRILFMASKWDEDKLVEERHCWYYPSAALAEQLLAGWKQFAKDLAAYVPPVAEDPKPVGKAPETLPALRIEVTGAVTASNLAEFKATALTAIRSVNRELVTDADFANAEASVKWCEEVETRLKAAKEHALSQTQSIDALFKTIDDISAEAAKVRIELGKLVKARKESIKGEIVAAGVAAFAKYIRELNAAMPSAYMPQIPADFGGCIKNLRTVDSIRNAVDTELARAKIAAADIANRIQVNVKTLKTEADDWGFLFPDLAQAANKPAEDFANLLAARVAKYQQDREDARRRAVKLEEERLAREAAARQAAEQTARVVQQAAAPAAGLGQEAARDTGPIPRTLEELIERPAAPATADNGERLTLGQINERIAPLQITVAGLAQLGFVPVATDKSAKLYRESDFPAICAALVNHITEASRSAKVTVMHLAAEAV